MTFPFCITREIIRLFQSEIILFIIVVRAVVFDVALLIEYPREALVLAVDVILVDILILRVGQHGFVDGHHIHFTLGLQVPAHEQDNDRQHDHRHQNMVPFQALAEFHQLLLALFAQIRKMLLLRRQRFFRRGILFSLFSRAEGTVLLSVRRRQTARSRSRR